MRKEILADNIKHNDYEIVRMKEMGNIIELMTSEHKNTVCPILKLNKEMYVNTITGEVKNFEHNDSRADDKNSVRQSLQKLRDYINTNVTNLENVLWITLTYAENMQDPKRLYKDFEKFIKRLHYKYGEFEYIVAMEPQARGAWHAHVMPIFKSKAPFIPNKVLSEIWGLGFVKITKLDNVDNVGAYLTAYLADMELSEYYDAGFKKTEKQNNIKFIESNDENGNRKTKAYVKGARLNMYPPKFNLFRCSRGIKRPTMSYVTEKQAMKKVGNSIPTYEKTVKVSDDNGFDNVLNYRYFNTVRKENQY